MRILPLPLHLAVSVLTTLERRFNLQSADVGVIASSFEIGNLALILFVSYFGAKAHRPRLIGCGGIVMALGALLSALPEFLTHQYEYEDGDSWHAEDGRDVFPTRPAQVLIGIGATPVQPLGVSYIDDHVHKKDSSLYIGESCGSVKATDWFSNVILDSNDHQQFNSSEMSSIGDV
ncbi:Solute carrier organic anion transporter family member 3A1 [Oryzias melastigma]|uniref:Solute carrier organic anion transporter family member 3A1 n=1 Tax=Oryzias melastigma TaxID=30732 RepID=A0A834F7M6_ORYME|nr:Solute carrier organic anion transporter family member 3A1 [Oryzias melastigma]